VLTGFLRVISQQMRLPCDEVRLILLDSGDDALVQSRRRLAGMLS